MKTLNLIGCGAVGRTLGRLLREAGLFEIQDILTRSLASARQGAEFIGAGRPVASLGELRPADLYLIAVSDDAIGQVAKELALSGRLPAGALVCHLSGALSSAELAPAAAAGALVASLHPVKSFADPLESIGSFAGTWCGIEGDPAAVELLAAVCAALGARTFAVDPRFKTIYHAAAVLACNYLTSLLEVGVRACGQAGLARETALQVLEPLVRGTVDNVFRAGTVQALTGPIARGDATTVARQLSALENWDGEVALIYRALGRVALELAQKRGQAAPEDLARLEELLRG